MKKFLSVFLALMIVATIGIPVFATGNEWVMDESQVLSKETEDYIKALNEDVFATYKNKPQLAVVVIDYLPTEYTMDEYKLYLFNKYGIGTKEENCGLLFVLAIESREYGLEIGDGYESGSLLRKELSNDFITSETLESLRAGNWDDAIVQVIKHLEEIMANEEAGVYTAKEAEIAKQEAEMMAELKKIGSILFILAVSAAIICAIVFVSFKIGRYILTVSGIRKSIESHPEQMALIKATADTIGKTTMENMKHHGCSSSEANDMTMETIYKTFIDEQLDILLKMTESGKVKNNFTAYEKRLKHVNCIENFLIPEIKDINYIVSVVDKEIEEEEAIQAANFERIDEYIKKHTHLIPHGLVTLEELSFKIKRCCEKGILLEDKTIKYLFDRELKEKAFKRDYNDFIRKNKDKIDKKYFDNKDFYNAVRRSSHYNDYNYRTNNNLIWMMLLLNHHMDDNRHAEQIRIKKEEQRRQESFNSSDSFSSSNSSFGTSFGGGFSSGGGFSGGW